MAKFKIIAKNIQTSDGKSFGDIVEWDEAEGNEYCDRGIFEKVVTKAKKEKPETSQQDVIPPTTPEEDLSPNATNV